MPLPKIVILAQGGTHGDFLYSCCRLMLVDERQFVSASGRVQEHSIFKRQNLKSYNKGEKIPIDYNTEEEVSVCHIWQKEFLSWPSKFYYIEFSNEQIPIIKQMFLDKVCNQDINFAIDLTKKYFPDSLAKKVNLKNFDRIWTLLYKNSLRKYKLQSGAMAVNITDLYDIKKIIEILKTMEIYDKSKYQFLTHFHDSWLSSNKKHIDALLRNHK